MVTEEVVHADEMWRLTQQRADEVIVAAAIRAGIACFTDPAVNATYKPEEVAAILWANILHRNVHNRLVNAVSGGLEKRKSLARVHVKGAVEAVERISKAARKKLLGVIDKATNVTSALFATDKLRGEEGKRAILDSAAAALDGTGLTLASVNTTETEAVVEIVAPTGRDVHALEAHKHATALFAAAAKLVTPPAEAP